MAEPIDIVLLTFNRLDYLIATVDNLEARTTQPYRLTIVDNASGADVRQWLADNRHRFHQVILRPTNEHLPAFQHGIDATTSDPFILAEPDLIVPDLSPCWLTRLRGHLDANPDFGLIGMGLDPVNRPSVLGPEVIDPASRHGEDIVEGNLGMWFQMLRRDALLVPYELDAQACEAIRNAGYRVGWTDTLRSYHLGWDDYKLHPGHLASKNPKVNRAYAHYKEIELIDRPPSLVELATAAPVLATTREAGIPDASVLELAWGGPAVAASVKGPVALDAPPASDLGLAAGAAGAVALVNPPEAQATSLLAEAFRIAADTVVVSAPLTTFGGALAPDLAPEGWTGRELPGPAVVPMALAKAADADPELEQHLGYKTLDERENWLALFAQAGFGNGPGRLWVWRRTEPLAVPAEVSLAGARVPAWQPKPPEVAAAPAFTFMDRVRGKLYRTALKRRVRAAQGRA
ncbi:glycosyltransferase [Solirubrobacter soli]|uniref:glycosyltransferase n=1 Tax=Solirubrobacter soli TaxID=363832 RepID=UPI0003FD7074|nr:glycosyltransferase [Solirubrobacter soli]